MSEDGGENGEAAGRPASRGWGARAHDLGASERRSDDFAPLESVHVDGAREVVCSRDGRTVYVAATDGFATVSFADPANPRILAELLGCAGGRSRLVFRRQHVAGSRRER